MTASLALAVAISIAGRIGTLPGVVQRPALVNLNEAEFRDRVYACWLGKNVGGTLGMPFEGRREVNQVTGYTDLKPGEPAANDDLDLQLLWLKAMQDHGGRVDARILGEYWLKHVPVDWNEYGVGKANMRLGLLPPLSGEFRNDQWKHSNGAWIRTEIWACLAPGSPAEAARMAREDACVDHGAAEGTLAAIFVAALESAAFVEKDRDKLLEIGLAMIPRECQVALAVRTAMKAHADKKPWMEAREAIVAATESTGWFQAPRNVAFVVIGWLYGKDFGDSLCKAVNCGDDTDCTGATLGSLLGILDGTQAIPRKWSEPIGKQIKTVAISGFDNVSNLDDLTAQTVAMAKRVASERKLKVGLSSGATDLSRVGRLKLADVEAVKKLWKLSPYQVVWEEADLVVSLDYSGPPVVRLGSERTLLLSVSSARGKAMDASVAVGGLPEGWLCRTVRSGPGKHRIIVSPGGKVPEHTRLEVAVSAAGGTVRIPAALFAEKP